MKQEDINQIIGQSPEAKCQQRTRDNRVWPDDFASDGVDWRSIALKRADELDQQAAQIEELKRELSRIRIIEDNAVRLNAEYANEIDRLKRLLGDCANAISEVYEQYPTDKEWPERLGYSAKDFKRIVAKCDEACGIKERTGQ